MRFDSLGLVDFAVELVNSVLNLPGGQVNFFVLGVGAGAGAGERVGEGRMGERMEKGPPFHFVKTAMRKPSRLHPKAVSSLSVI